jgi:hypothetical protein
MLRASVESSGEEGVELRGVTGEAESGVPHGSALVRFAEQVVSDGDDRDRARDELAEAMGPAALVDAAAVVGNFERMVRIADGTGIPLDTPVQALTGKLRADLGLDDYSSASNSREPGRVAAALGRLGLPVLLGAIRLVGRRSSRRPGG